MARTSSTYPQSPASVTPSVTKKTVANKKLASNPAAAPVRAARKKAQTPQQGSTPTISSSHTHQDLWTQCLEYLQQFLPEQQINNWLRPLQTQLQEDGTELKIYVASRFKMDYTRSQYSAIITKALAHLTGRQIALSFAVGKPKLELRPLNTSTNTKNATAQIGIAPDAGIKTDQHLDQQDLALSHLEAAPHSSEKKHTRLLNKNKEKNSGHHLNASLRFDNLVVGSANHMAYTAAMNVASAHADVHYNPLFIYGASGLGKTHMLHAIGNQYLNHKPDAKVLYTHADKFVGDVVKAFRFNSFEEFRQLYYNLDILLIDDVQEFSVGDKAKTLEEFFYLFQALLSKHSLIVLTSDTFPKELQKIPDRLISRFVSGLTVALDPPPMEMRVAILMKKAEESGFTLPAEVAFFIAKNVQSNVRELEGALRTVHAYAQFQNKGQKISVHIAKEALRDLLSAHKRQITIENIQKTVADYYRLKIADMHSKRRPANIAKPRQIAMYLSKEMTQKSLPEIGSAFGGRDHTTVLHAVKKINKERQVDEQLRHDLHILEQSLKG